MRNPRANTFLGKAVMKAILSERFATWSYQQIAALSEDPAHIQRALEDSKEEARHAIALAKAASRDGITLLEPENADHQMDELRAAFSSMADAGDRVACVFAQDILLEHVAIHIYEALQVGARNANAPVLGALLVQILADEREHVASAVEELRHEVTPAEQQRAFQRAFATLLPILNKYGTVAPGTPCGQICSTCRDRCCQLDAEAVGMPFANGTTRLLTAIQGTMAQLQTAVPA